MVYLISRSKAIKSGLNNWKLAVNVRMELTLSNLTEYKQTNPQIQDETHQPNACVRPHYMRAIVSIC